jgi:hypothetical protein
MPLGDLAAATLTVRLAIEEPVLAGRAALARIEVANRGAAAILASRRLNLMEGDLRLIATDAEGLRRVVRGWQVDSGLDRVVLEPGRRLVGAVNLLEVGDGPLFTRTGLHRLAVEYDPSPREPSLPSEAVTVAVRAAETEADVALAELLGDAALRKALLFAEADAAPEAMRRLAERHPGTLEGELARLILAATAGTSEDWAAAAAALGLDRLALAILALANPRSGIGGALAGSLAAWLAARATADAGVGTALAMVRRDPLPAA